MVMVDGRRSGWPQPMQLSVKPWRGLRTQSKPLTCISMPVLRFSSDAEVVKFAKAFLREHLERFRKDIGICLTRDKNKAHAYFPALISCISFADLLSGLYAGTLDKQRLK